MRDHVEEAADDIADDNDCDSKQRCILELSSLNKILSAVPCDYCGGLLTAVFGDKMGFSREIKVVCQECEFRVEQYSCTRLDGSNKMTTGFDVNYSMVHCFNELGCGEAALRKFSAIMAIPGLAHNTYRRLSKKVGRAHTEVTANVMTAAVHAVRDMPDQGECAAVHDIDEDNDSGTDSDCDGEGVGDHQGGDGGDED